jgi:hypothetical protein
LSVAFVSTFIGIFFFTYAKTVEKKIVLNNVTYTINGLVDSFLTLIKSTEYGKYINLSQLSSNPDPADAEADKVVIAANKKLLIMAACVISILLITVLLLVFFISHKYNLNFKEMIIENLILVTGIGITEFLFLNLVARQFIAADNNFIIKKILTLFNKKEN